MSQGSRKPSYFLIPKPYFIGFYVYVFSKCKQIFCLCTYTNFNGVNSKGPPSRHLLPDLPGPGRLPAPAGPATSGRAGRCAAPWRPASRSLRRPAPHLAVGGRSRTEGDRSVMVARAVSARPVPAPRPRAAGLPQGQSQPRLLAACPSATAMPPRVLVSSPCILSASRPCFLGLVQRFLYANTIVQTASRGLRIRTS